jgi:hypothetical protein
MVDWVCIGAAAPPIASIDWTPVLTGLIGALVGGVVAWFGYLAAKRANDLERTRIEVESERVHIQRQDAMLNRRAAAYQDFLDSALNFHLGAAGRDPKYESSEWLRVHEHNLTSICLFGTEEARHAAQKLGNIMNDAFHVSPEEYETKHQDKVLVQWERVIDAARKDTAPSPD